MHIISSSQLHRVTNSTRSSLWFLSTPLSLGSSLSLWAKSSLLIFSLWPTRLMFLNSFRHCSLRCLICFSLSLSFSTYLRRSSFSSCSFFTCLSLSWRSFTCWVSLFSFLVSFYCSSSIWSAFCLTSFLRSLFFICWFASWAWSCFSFSWLGVEWSLDLPS